MWKRAAENPRMWIVKSELNWNEKQRHILHTWLLFCHLRFQFMLHWSSTWASESIIKETKKNPGKLACFFQDIEILLDFLLASQESSLRAAMVSLVRGRSHVLPSSATHFCHPLWEVIGLYFLLINCSKQLSLVNLNHFLPQYGTRQIASWRKKTAG